MEDALILRAIPYSAPCTCHSNFLPLISLKFTAGTVSVAICMCNNYTPLLSNVWLCSPCSDRTLYIRNGGHRLTQSCQDWSRYRASSKPSLLGDHSSFHSLIHDLASFMLLFVKFEAKLCHVTILELKPPLTSFLLLWLITLQHRVETSQQTSPCPKISKERVMNQRTVCPPSLQSKNSRAASR